MPLTKEQKKLFSTLDLAWHHFPQLRLGQLIANVTNADLIGLFYMEDAKLNELLLKFIEDNSTKEDLENI